MSALAALAAAAVIVPVLWAFGERLLRTFAVEPQGLAERFGLGLAVGYAVCIVSVFGLAVLRWASFSPVLVLLAAFAAVGFPVLRGLPAELRDLAKSIPGRLRGGLPLLVSLFALSALVYSLAPPTGFDATVLHFVSAKRMAGLRGLPLDDPAPWFHRSGGLTFVHLLGFVLQGEILAKLLNFAAFGAALAVVAAASSRLAPGSATWAAALFATCPFVVGFWGYEWLESGVLLFASSSAFSLARVLTGGPSGWLAAALAFSGFAAGIKTSAFASLAAGAAALLLGLVRPRPRPWSAIGWGSLAGALGFFLWPAWNRFSVQHALPFHPVASLPPSGSSPVPETLPSALLAALDALGQILTVSRYWNDAAGPLLVVGLAGVVLLRLRSPEGFLAVLAVGAVVLHLAVLAAVGRPYLSASNTSHGRYLAPTLLGFGLPVAAAFARAVQAGPPWLRSGYLAAFLLLAAPLLVLKAGKAAVAAPVVLGLESRDRYLAKKIEVYEACRMANGLPGEVRVFYLGSRPYYLDRPWNSVEELPAGAARSVSELVPWLDRLRITHVLVEPYGSADPASLSPREFDLHPRFHEIGSWRYRNHLRVRLLEFLPNRP
jgi:hypothetical protein